MNGVPAWVVLWLGVTPALGVLAAAAIPGRLTWARGLVGALVAQLAASVTILLGGWDLFGGPAVGSPVAPPGTLAEQLLLLLYPLPSALVEGGLVTAVLRLLGRRGRSGARGSGRVLYDRDVSKREPLPRIADSSDARGAADVGQGRPAPYAAAWRDHRRRWGFLGGALVGGYVLMRGDVAAALDAAFGFDAGARVFGFVAVPAVAIALARLVAWRCPRCGHSYAARGGYHGSANLFTRRCVHCGLPRWAGLDSLHPVPPVLHDLPPDRAPDSWAARLGPSACPRQWIPVDRGRAGVSERRPAELEAYPSAPRAAQAAAVERPVRDATAPRFREGSSVRVVRPPARAVAARDAASAPHVDDVGVVLEVRAHETGAPTYVVMSGDPTAGRAWWAEFTAEELQPD